MLGFLLGISVALNLLLLYGYKIWVDKCEEHIKLIDEMEENYKNKFEDIIRRANEKTQG